MFEMAWFVAAAIILPIIWAGKIIRAVPSSCVRFFVWAGQLALRMYMSCLRSLPGYRAELAAAAAHHEAEKIVMQQDLECQTAKLEKLRAAYQALQHRMATSTQELRQQMQDQKVQHDADMSRQQAALEAAVNEAKAESDAAAQRYAGALQKRLRDVQSELQNRTEGLQLAQRELKLAEEDLEQAEQKLQQAQHTGNRLAGQKQEGARLLEELQPVHLAEVTSHCMLYIN